MNKIKYSICLSKSQQKSKYLSKKVETFPNYAQTCLKCKTEKNQIKYLFLKIKTIKNAYRKLPT